MAFYTPFLVCLEHTLREEKPPQAQHTAGAEEICRRQERINERVSKWGFLPDGPSRLPQTCQLTSCCSLPRALLLCPVAALAICCQPLVTA